MEPLAVAVVHDIKYKIVCSGPFGSSCPGPNPHSTGSFNVARASCAWFTGETCHSAKLKHQPNEQFVSSPDFTDNLAHLRDDE
jgi:hypothetical protein